MLPAILASSFLRLATNSSQRVEVGQLFTLASELASVLKAELPSTLEMCAFSYITQAVYDNVV